MHVLFVGATGSIGRQVVPILAARFDLKLAALEAARIGEMEVIPTDISDFSQALALMDDVDAVVNSAIESPRRRDGSTLNSQDPDDLMRYQEGGVEVNIRGAYHLYEAAARRGIKKFVYISSMTAVYGKPYYDYIPRDAPVRPTSFYACSKIFGENLGQFYAAEGKMNVLCLRIGQPYPVSEPSDTAWHDNPKLRSGMVAMQDIARAMQCALLDDKVSFGVYPVLSHSDVSRVDTSAAEEIGYVPAYSFTADGVINRDA